ncbi:hypothetical protein [Nocardioides nanhaiensis]|uniref:Head-tail adaptor protein n=1 Tax=Nocardioides nanhaiensis TaxID=1476871 RepID=A0ABP8W5B8_9ACTN
MIFGQSIVRIRAGQRTTRGGDTVEDWSPEAVTRRLIGGVSVQPNFQNEDTDNGGSITRATGYRVLTPPGKAPDIRSTDRIEYRGEVHAVTGEVAYWPDPHGADHIEFTMTAWKGA